MTAMIKHMREKIEQLREQNKLISESSNLIPAEREHLFKNIGEIKGLTYACDMLYLNDKRPPTLPLERVELSAYPEGHKDKTG